MAGYADTKNITPDTEEHSMKRKIAALGAAAALILGGAVATAPAEAAAAVRKCVMVTPYSTTFARVTNTAGGSTILYPGQEFCAYNFAGLEIPPVRSANLFRTRPGDSVIQLSQGRYPNAVRGSISTKFYLTVYKR